MENKSTITIKQHNWDGKSKHIFHEFIKTIKFPETNEEKEKVVDEIVKAFNEQNINNNIKAVKVNEK